MRERKSKGKQRARLFNTASFTKNIARRVGVAVCAVLILFGCISVFLTGKASQQATEETLHYVAMENGMDIVEKNQYFMDQMHPIIKVLEKMYSVTDDGKRTRTSDITGDKLTPLRDDAENTIVSTVEALLECDENILGIGVTFEKDGFEKGTTYGLLDKCFLVA